jgi:two-component system OmpR family response regulator
MNGRRRILVVDDDPAVRSVVKLALERAGYDVTTARDGREAIMRIAASDFDLVLLDVRLPKLDGLDVVEELRTSNSPVLAHTLLLDQPLDIRALLASAKDCIGH